MKTVAKNTYYHNLVIIYLKDLHSCIFTVRLQNYSVSQQPNEDRERERVRDIDRWSPL